MARRKKKKVEEEYEEEEYEIEHGTKIKRSILAILFFLLMIVFILAPLGLAGKAGGFIHQKFLLLLFGSGFFLAPAACLGLGIVFSRVDEPLPSHWRFLAGGIALVAILGLFELVSKSNAGGYIGMVAKPLVSLFDVYLTAAILIALSLGGLIFSMQIPMRIPDFVKNLFKKSESNEEFDYDSLEDEEYEDEEEAEEDEDYEEDEVEEEDEELEEESEPEPENTAKNPLSVFGLGNAGKTSTSLYKYSPPPLSLLAKTKGKPGTGDIKSNANLIQRTLRNFNIDVEMDDITIGPTVTRYSVKPAEGVKLSRIMNLSNELALALAAHPIRIEAPIPGTSLVGIEVPNKTKATVGLASLLGDKEFKNSPFPLPIALGKGVSGKAYYANVAKMPHLLIAGATGAGKSVTVHEIITSLLYSKGPDDLRFIFVDPKRVELTLYNRIPHLLTPVIKEPKKAILALKWAVKEMERRYDVLEGESVRDVQSYHKNIVEPAFAKFKKSGGDELELPERMPYIVIIIDELADIMTAYPRELESGIVRLAQMSRAVGIHLILSTQRPSVNVITGLIKANVPSRLALQVSSQIDSRTILDSSGAEKLLGAGDMLYMSGQMSKPARMQSAYISEEEVKKIVEYIVKKNRDGLFDEMSFSDAGGDGGSSGSTTIFDSDLEGDDDEDELYPQAKQTVIEAGKASTSYLQRKLKVGYSRAARLMDILEERGVIGQANGSKPREILVGDDEPEEIEEEEADEEEYDTGYESEELEEMADDLLEEEESEDEEEYEEEKE